jgi:hypothetical protein
MKKKICEKTPSKKIELRNTKITEQRQNQTNNKQTAKQLQMGQTEKKITRSIGQGVGCVCGRIV